jgi:acetyltransferase-like isoleucine patch superfamily enzyme
MRMNFHALTNEADNKKETKALLIFITQSESILKSEMDRCFDAGFNVIAGCLRENESEGELIDALKENISIHASRGSPVGLIVSEKFAHRARNWKLELKAHGLISVVPPMVSPTSVEIDKNVLMRAASQRYELRVVEPGDILALWVASSIAVTTGSVRAKFTWKTHSPATGGFERPESTEICEIEKESLPLSEKVLCSEIPANACGFVAVSLEKLKTGMFQAADVTDLESLNAVAPHWGLGLYYMGSALLEAKDLSSAVRTLKSAVENDPGLGRARMKLAQTLYRMDRKEECLACLQVFFDRKKISFGICELACRSHADCEQYSDVVRVAEEGLRLPGLKQDQVVKLRRIIIAAAGKIRDLHSQDDLLRDQGTIHGKITPEERVPTPPPREASDHIERIDLDRGNYELVHFPHVNVAIKGSGHANIYVKGFRARSNVLIEVPENSVGSAVFFGNDFHGDVRIRLSGANSLVYFGNDCNLKGLDIDIHESNCSVFVGNGVTCQQGNVWSVAGNSDGYKPSLILGDDVMLSFSVVLLTTDGHPIHSFDDGGRKNTPTADLVIEPHVWVGYRATVQKNVTVGACSIVSASSIVTKSVPRFARAQGVPASTKSLGNVFWSRNETRESIDSAKYFYSKYK